MQEQILERHPDANVRVYVVWLPRVPTAQRFRVTDEMPDGRAVHYWDEGMLAAEHFGDASDYDVFLLFGPDATWGDPPGETGRPVVAETARLGRALEPYL